MRKYILLLLICFSFLRTNAQEDSLQANRLVMHSTLYGIGSINILDTYLSPLEYKGTLLNLLREDMRFTKLLGGKVSIQNMLHVNMALTKNKADTSNEISSMVKWTYAWNYQMRINQNLKILFGPMIDINGGFVYNIRNSNNPAQAKAYTSIDASGMLIYKFRLWNHPLVARYQMNLPLLGLMFSPDYGQSYYEIFSLGHWNSKNIVFTHPCNHPSIMHLLTIDCPINRINLRLGYLCDIEQANANGLKSHMWNHSFMVGLIKNFYLIKGKNKISMPSQLTPY